MRLARLVTEFLDKAVEEYPEKTAFIDNEKRITYKELQEDSYSISSAIIDEGLFRKPIAIYLNKSIECIASFLGVAYSGNFYTLLDIEMIMSI